MLNLQLKEILEKLDKVLEVIERHKEAERIKFYAKHCTTCVYCNNMEPGGPCFQDKCSKKPSMIKEWEIRHSPQS